MHKPITFPCHCIHVYVHVYVYVQLHEYAYIYVVCSCTCYYLCLFIFVCCGGDMCGSWGKGSHLGSRGARPARRGKRRAVGFRQWRRVDVTRFLKTQETGSPHLQETFMHRVSVIVHCVAVIHYNHNRNRVLLYCLFQENKSFGTGHHLHSSSDVWEVVLSTIFMLRLCSCCMNMNMNIKLNISMDAYTRHGRVQYMYKRIRRKYVLLRYCLRAPYHRNCELPHNSNISEI
jgi:hypothetical protein